ncbi:MAG TPA: MBOAT family O-acyltransferase [Polyangiaceae bacterium]|jgi:D-alanyl-lipoteichoic acid acyltransferase DltB (MBOAT superfamily)|nr:MBOAT family O-acyltransferase [Polyangiaceae bacterium]
MAFNSFSFILLLLCSLGLYFSTRRLLLRQLLLVAVSLGFYAAWDYRFVALLAYVICVAFVGGQAVNRSRTKKKLFLGLAIGLQLAQLVFFKYTNFLFDLVADVAGWVGANHAHRHLDILLPAGISFYTFHGISYVVDVYRKKIERAENLIVVALYIAFFPQLVAGPIVRADVFIPQSKRVLDIDSRDFIVGLKFITLGLIYKCVFADRLAPLVDTVFDAPAHYENGVLARAALGFYAQIYFDFAGYSTMAIGISRLFGFKLPRNFNYPYRALDITDFWKRWHISLSSWLRDYLYIPLGGNRAGKLKQYRNLMLTMLLGGLWHGASINFVVWGALHGAALCVHKLWSERWPSTRGTRPVQIARSVLGWFLTQAFVLVAWIPFRASSFAATQQFAMALLGTRTVENAKQLHIPLLLLLLPIVADQVLVQNPNLPAFPWPKRPWLLVTVLALCFALALPFVVLKTKAFIYFQF